MTIKQNILLILILVFSSFATIAQDKGKYIPLFDNIQSDEATNMQKKYNNELKIAVPQTYADIKISEAIPALKSFYNAGKIAETMEFSTLIQKHFRHNDKEGSEYMVYRISAFKDAGLDHEADSMILNFRKKFPFYEIKKDEDPIVFQDLMQNYYTRPLLSFGVAVTKLFPMIKVDTVFNIAKEDTARAVSYHNFKYLMNEAFLQFYITSQLSTTIGLSFSKLEFTRKSKPTTSIEKTSSYWIPIRLSYNFKPKFIKSLYPELFVGAKIGYTKQKEYNITTLIQKGNSYEEKLDTISNTYKPKQSDKYINCIVFGGVRLNYSIRRFCVFADYSFGYSLKELNNSKSNDTPMSFASNFTPDAVRILETGIAIGFKVNFCYKTFIKYNYGY